MTTPQSPAGVEDIAYCACGKPAGLIRGILRPTGDQPGEAQAICLECADISPGLAAQIREGIAGAEAGETVDLDSFGPYLDPHYRDDGDD